MWNAELKIAVGKCRRAVFAPCTMPVSASASRWMRRSMRALGASSIGRDRQTDFARSPAVTAPTVARAIATSIIAATAQAYHSTNDIAATLAALMNANAKPKAATGFARCIATVKSTVSRWTRHTATVRHWAQCARQAGAICMSKLPTVGNITTAKSWKSISVGRFTPMKPSTTSTATVRTIASRIWSCGRHRIRQVSAS